MLLQGVIKVDKDQTNNAQSASWVERELTKKSDRGVVTTKFKSIDDKLNDLTGRIDKKESCIQGDKIDNALRLGELNQKNLSEMYKWYARGFAAVIIVLLTSGAMFVWYLAGLSYNLEANNKSLDFIEERHRAEDGEGKLSASEIKNVIEEALQEELKKNK